MDDFKNVFSFEGKTALIVGGGGIGLPIAQALMENGADIILAGTKEKKAENPLPEIAKRKHKKYFFVKVDLLDAKSCVNMVEEAALKTGRIDILVNAAGVNKLKKAEEYDDETWDYVLGINLRGLHLVTSAVGKHMIRRRYGRILSVSSVKSLIGTDQDYIAYCASKGAVNMYTKQLACEWGKYGITVNAIAPTFTRTAINSFQLDDPVFYKNLINRIPLGRICTTKDLAYAALFFCSDAAEFITGQILFVDGGLTSKQ
ncbi:SDR family oxidoreductase [Treponema parvum]|uniref:SDR family oxidoreductase n=1 Tax=Treponema parvum TaxID=138851 RepID=A0A975F2G4_9SPIR|nr:SDR family oxidoreductase [Treponema parvum]QTQ13161.1 SDR family oxidoreductase [Treponema parvum]